MIFSLLNLFTVYKMLRRFKKMQNLPNRTMWLVYAHVGMFTWISSSLFHMFDCDFTEKMDYFGAYSFVLFALYVSVIFTKQLQFLGRGGPKYIQILFALVYLNHFMKMMQNFDYGYNMTCCIVFSLITTCLYVHHLYYRKRNLGSLQESDIVLIRLIIWANLSTALEILDFTPVFWIFDSHSLSHLATIPIPIWWSDFLALYYDLDVASGKRSVLKMA